MSPITELAHLTLSPTIPDSTIASVLATNTRALLSRPGCLRVRSSLATSHPSQQQAEKHLRLFIDWTSLAAHAAFGTDAPAEYAAFRKRFADIVAPSAGMRRPFHVFFQEGEVARDDDNANDNDNEDSDDDYTGASVLDHGAKTQVAELVHVYYPDHEKTGEEKGRGLQTARDVAAALAKLALPGWTGQSAAGWSVERDVLYQGRPCQVLVMVFGWDSVEACEKARGGEGFARVVAPVLGRFGKEKGEKGVVGMEVCYVSNTTTESSG
ncbi:uncharacterized protein GGS25DRAFT_532460 [Hypoxylon fragiforme]|uniref:uncharacterized protein n=1 Tax=Hypoxylon fragiforme TaxID=63214 RepID=UPI0020C6FBF1|nr:uncharacterized protein GGS25DRAFT_532460 [Hypoxylon fragiforme]KAI2607247.1 hypothetical protein GGS25DRAFT_532460 [Hypoxylon fragiforme]